MTGVLKKQSKQINIDINISEILTQRTCGNILIEIIKFIAYQKLQTPYSFDRLKYVVDKKREKDKNGRSETESWQSQKYFRLASTAFDALDAVFKNLMLELESDTLPQEVCILLGSSPLCAKEVYRVIVPSSLPSHFHRNHSNNAQKLTMKVLRNICFSQDLQKIVYNALGPTNMFVFIKRNDSLNDTNDSMVAENISAFAKFFLPVDTLRISPKVPQAVINLKYAPDTTVNCCSKLLIFTELSPKCVKKNVDCNGVASEKDSDNVNKHNDSCGNEANVFDDKNWCQAMETFKGFKDCYINGHSISDSWVSES